MNIPGQGQHGPHQGSHLTPQKEHTMSVKQEHYQTVDNEFSQGFVQILNDVEYSKQAGYDVSTFEIIVNSEGFQAVITLTADAFKRFVEGAADVHGDIVVQERA